MRPTEPEPRAVVPKVALEQSGGDLLPTDGRVTPVAVAPHPPFVLVAVAVSAATERDTGVPQHRRITLAKRFVAPQAIHVAMATRERVARVLVIEPARGFPAALGVAVGTGAIDKLIPVWIVLRVALTTCGPQSQERPVEGTVLSLEVPNVGRDDQLRRVAFPTVQLSMVLDQVESRLGMIERGRVEPHDGEVAAEVLLVAFRAVPVGYRGVIAPLLLDAVALRLVALETEIVGDPSFSEAVTVRAIADALKVRVRF